MDQLLSADEFIRETRHRVKNSLQLVASMLAEQARQSRDEALVKSLREAIGRISAAAHLHERLQYDERRMVDAAEYLRTICNDLAVNAAGNCEVRLEAHHIEIAGPEALALGLIANELITNALKYAYPQARGAVIVQFERTGAELRLSVADSGAGISGSSEGLGLTFARLLARRLHGAFEILDREPGTCIQLQFPMRKEAGEERATE